MDSAGQLRSAVESVKPPTSSNVYDYRIAKQVGCGYLARARSGSPAYLIPLAGESADVGRRGGGFALNAVSSVAFCYDGRDWNQAAAVLECTDLSLSDTFFVLVLDLNARLERDVPKRRWPLILQWLEEWQALLTRRAALTPEQQLGLWGELWFIARSSRADFLVSAWRGPDTDPVDFFADGLGLEVKASRRAHIHYVSHRQVRSPVGDSESYLLSAWVGVDPTRGVSLIDLVDEIVSTVTDAPKFLKKLSQVGYSIIDRDQYETKYVMLEEPLWFRLVDVPRVRDIDDGVSEIRYVVTLDPEKALNESEVRPLCRRFWNVPWADERS